MPRMPSATWIGPTPNLTPGGMGHVRGMVLHIQQGGEAGSEAWLKNPQSQASAHFLNPKVGGLRQLVDTADKAWAQAAGNNSWISVENEGLSGQALTASQVENCAKLLAWLHVEYGVPVAPTDNPDGAGLGWHGMGGQAWGGHFDCPGDPIKAQRSLIASYAAHLLAQPVVNQTKGSPVVIFTDSNKQGGVKTDGLGYAGLAPDEWAALAHANMDNPQAVVIVTPGPGKAFTDADHAALRKLVK